MQVDESQCFWALSKVKEGLNAFGVGTGLVANSVLQVDYLLHVPSSIWLRPLERLNICLYTYIYICPVVVCSL